MGIGKAFKKLLGKKKAAQQGQGHAQDFGSNSGMQLGEQESSSETSVLDAAESALSASGSDWARNPENFLEFEDTDLEALALMYDAPSVEEEAPVERSAKPNKWTPFGKKKPASHMKDKHVKKSKKLGAGSFGHV